MKPKTWLDSANVAIEGIIYSVKTERHMRAHLVAAIVTLILGLLLHVSRIEFILLSIAIVLVLLAEMVNTAIEVAVDMVAEDYHPLAKVAKDISAGFVLLTSVGALIVGYFILYPAFKSTLGRGVWQVRKVSGDMVAFVSLTVVVLLVIFIKALFGKGEPLRGGMPSGHAAFFFALWAASLHLTTSLIVILGTFVVAVLVSWSRWLSEIHRPVEVVAGALLGTGVTAVLFWVFT